MAYLTLSFPQPPVAYRLSMLFLLNDVILTIEGSKHTPRIAGRKLKALNFNAVSHLGQELYAAEPLLHHKDPEKAQRLAALIIAKAPDINAALFIAPSRGCLVDQVQVRYAQLGLEVMGALLQRQNAGGLSNVEADRQVWRRLAA